MEFACLGRLKRQQRKWFQIDLMWADGGTDALFALFSTSFSSIPNRPTEDSEERERERTLDTLFVKRTQASRHHVIQIFFNFPEVLNFSTFSTRLCSMSFYFKKHELLGTSIKRMVLLSTVHIAVNKDVANKNRTASKLRVISFERYTFMLLAEIGFNNLNVTFLDSTAKIK